MQTAIFFFTLVLSSPTSDAYSRTSTSRSKVEPVWGSTWHPRRPWTATSMEIGVSTTSDLSRPNSLQGLAHAPKV